jgi:hypothetical protein
MAATPLFMLAQQIRKHYCETLLQGLPVVLQAIDLGARLQLGKVAEPESIASRRDVIHDLRRCLPQWFIAIRSQLIEISTLNGQKSSTVPISGRDTKLEKLSLVEDDVIQQEIMSSRLAQAMLERAGTEYNDLSARICHLEQREKLDSEDLFSPFRFAKLITSSWNQAGLTQTNWTTVQVILHDEFANFIEELYHSTNQILVNEKVLPEVDLRPFIRRAKSAKLHTSTAAQFSQFAGLASQYGASQLANETRLITNNAPLDSAELARATLSRFNKLIGRQLPDFANPARLVGPLSIDFKTAIEQAQRKIAEKLMEVGDENSVQVPISTPGLLEEMHRGKAQLKQAATSQIERATIEVVALLFQSLLTEERIPASVRLWFARLQMPVLRVAVNEPDFFAETTHPTRALIDRMGACVMGFDSNTPHTSSLLEKEIKRIVQVVEAYPETGRKVFQTVLIEFEKFLQHYFQNENEMSIKAISLAQQVEQRETLAIQYTIELRKMLNDFSVQEGIRDFLFQIWADVLAMNSVKFGLQSAQTKAMRRAASDLIWSASAKVSREERAEVIRKLPHLLKALRDGMESAGLAPEKQDNHLQQLNSSLAAAFTAKTSSISRQHLDQLMHRLETLEELLPDLNEIEIDESFILDLSEHESSGLEVVADGGAMPTSAMLAWAQELQVGGWYMLDYRGRREQVQLSWHGMHQHLSLFVSPQGRCILFQKQRLAAFLQAGLLVPAQAEALTVKATRSAFAKLDADPGRLLS